MYHPVRKGFGFRIVATIGFLGDVKHDFAHHGKIHCSPPKVSRHIPRSKMQSTTGTE
jgi:hypothetical protein